ncbi:MAG: ABC transporter permease [Clostridia bacterium]|nr:ABC transporter permease [Clostridia bacterium]
MRNILGIAGNNIKRMLKKISGILIYLVLPPMLAVVFMLMVSSGQSSVIPIGITDGDGSVSSAEITRYIEESDKYTVVMYGEGTLEAVVAGKEVRAGIFISAGFEEYMTGGGEAVVEVISIEGMSVTGWLRGYLEQKISMLHKAGGMLGDMAEYRDVIGEYSGKYVKTESVEVLDKSNKMSGTRAGFGMFTFASMFGIWSICALGFREKVRRTYQRIMSCPVTPWQYAAGNTLACMFFALMHAVISITISYNLFDLGGILPIGGFIVLISVFYMAVIPMGFLLMSLGRSEAAVMAVNVVVLTLTCMLGGCYWQVEWMPEAMQRMARGTIQFWFTDGIDTLMKQGSLSSISTNLIVLAACGVAFSLAYIFIEKSKKNKMAV